MIFIQNIRKVFLLTFLLMVLSACGDNDNPGDNNTTNLPGVRTAGTGTALKLPRSIAVGKANIDSGAVAGQSTNTPIQAAAATDLGTDYSTDPVTEGSSGDSNMAMQFTNTMLCLLDEVKATDKVNQGIFLGSVPYNICNQSGRDSATAGKKINLIVNSTRADDSSPQYIQIWMEDYIELTPVKFIVEFVVNQGVSGQYPFGLFNVNYSGYVADSMDTPIANWEPYLDASIRSSQNAAGLPRFEFLLDQNDIINATNSHFSFRSITQITSTDLLNGQSRASMKGVGGIVLDNTGNSIFNGNYNLEINANANMCFSRNDLIIDVWGYNLYDAVTGARIPEPISPIAFDYTHLAANDRFNTDPNTNPYVGMSYQLKYWGPGQLSGLPYSMTTGRSEFYLADGTLLSDGGGADYLVKAVIIIYIPTTVDLALCDVLDANAPLTNPDLDLENLSAIELPGFRLTDWPTL